MCENEERVYERESVRVKRVYVRLEKLYMISRDIAATI